MRIRTRDPAPFWPWIRESGMEKLGSGLNITHPQHCVQIYGIKWPSTAKLLLLATDQNYVPAYCRYMLLPPSSNLRPMVGLSLWCQGWSLAGWPLQPPPAGLMGGGAPQPPPPPPSWGRPLHWPPPPFPGFAFQLSSLGFTGPSCRY
jgi:hypothetical protein